MFHGLRAEGKKVACVAQTGIASSLLPAGQTAHRFFKIPLTIEENMNCKMEFESPDAQKLREVDVVIWDEATMTDRRQLDAVHRFLQRLHQEEADRATAPFGGVTFVLSGDWKQCLPVDKKAKGESVVKSTVLNWQHWSKTFRVNTFKNIYRNIQVMQLTQLVRNQDDPVYGKYVEELGKGEHNSNTGKRPEDEKVTYFLDLFSLNLSQSNYLKFRLKLTKNFL